MRERAAALPEVMRGVVLTGHGGTDRLVFRDDLPLPLVGDEDVLIEVAAAGINNTDINTRIGWYSRDVSAGTDAAGREGVAARPTVPGAVRRSRSR